jgi:hypothetical protein
MPCGLVWRQGTDCEEMMLSVRSRSQTAGFSPLGLVQLYVCQALPRVGLLTPDRGALQEQQLHICLVAVLWLRAHVCAARLFVGLAVAVICHVTRACFSYKPSGLQVSGTP